MNFCTVTNKATENFTLLSLFLPFFVRESVGWSPGPEVKYSDNIICKTVLTWIKQLLVKSGSKLLVLLSEPYFSPPESQIDVYKH